MDPHMFDDLWIGFGFAALVIFIVGFFLGWVLL